MLDSNKRFASYFAAGSVLFYFLVLVKNLVYYFDYTLSVLFLNKGLEMYYFFYSSMNPKKNRQINRLFK